MKTLLIYYSYTGNTKIIADIIKQKLDCDVIELKPKIPFLIEDYDRIVDEYQSNESTKEKVDIKDINIDLEEYDKVIIGTSVWWYTITPVIRTFLTKYDLTGKDVYVFASNAGWLGRTFKEVESLCKGNIKGELNIKFSENWKDHKYLISDNELNSWIEKIK